MSKLIIFILSSFSLLIFSCGNKNNKKKDITKETFFDWAQEMPSLDACDSLYSNKKINVQNYKNTYLPKNSKLIGKIMTIGNEKMDTMNYFIVYLIEKENVKRYYLEIFNIYGKLFFNKEIFDFHFLSKNSNNFCKFYKDRDNGKYIIENYSNSFLKSTVKIDFMKILESKKMI